MTLLTGLIVLAGVATSSHADPSTSDGRLPAPQTGASQERPTVLRRISVNPKPSVQELQAANQGVIDGGEGGMVFPADSRVANIKAFGAVGDGLHDDTPAFRAALESNPKHTLIYVPHGTYVITDTLRWGRRQTRQVLQGQSRDGTVIRLMDRTPGFGDPDRPKTMVWTGDAPAQRFRNGVRDLTLDAGSGNPGAIGLRFMANNQGALVDLLIRSSDPAKAGHTGLDMGYTGEIGPLLMDNVTVEGFDTGVFTKHAVNSITGDGVTLRHQNKVGWLNDGQVVNLRQLRSQNAVTAFHNLRGAGLLTLIDSELVGEGAAPQTPAIRNEAAMFVRDVQTSGYAKSIVSVDRQGAEEIDAPTIDEFVSHEVLTLFDGTPPRSLRLPIQDAPAIPWGNPNDWQSVADFDPVQVTLTRPDGKRERHDDWSPAFQRAIDSGARTIYFPKRDSGPYRLLSDVVIAGNVERIIGMECEFKGAYGHQNAGHKATLVFKNDKPLIFERFDAIYTGTQFRHEGTGPLILRHLAMNEYNGLVKTEGSGDLFIEDVAFGGTIKVHGGRVWMRQYNPEGMRLPVKVANDGGTVWILGLKTEGDSLFIDTRNGGRSEVLGGFVYANKANDPDKVMFKIDGASAMSFTVGEWVGRKQPFDLVEQTHHGNARRLEYGDAYHRGEGSMAPLFVGVESP